MPIAQSARYDAPNHLDPRPLSAHTYSLPWLPLLCRDVLTGTCLNQPIQYALVDAIIMQCPRIYGTASPRKEVRPTYLNPYPFFTSKMSPITPSPIPDTHTHTHTPVFFFRSPKQTEQCVNPEARASRTASLLSPIQLVWREGNERVVFIFLRKRRD